MASRIRFESARPCWILLAQVLDQPYITSYNNWEGLAEKLDFKIREIEYIKTLRDETGSNTMKMFTQYVQRTNGGDLEEVMVALNDLKRLDALEILRSNYENIKRRSDREHEAMLMSPLPPAQPEPAARFVVSPQPPTDLPHSPSPQQVAYMPTRGQVENIPQHLWPHLVRDPNIGLRGLAYPQPSPASPMAEQPQKQPSLQEEPINLQKKRMDIYIQNKKTEDDFAHGFGQQFARDPTASINVEMDSIPFLHSGSTAESLAALRRLPPERPTSDFLDVLMRGEKQVDSLSHIPMVIAPTTMPSPNLPEPMETSYSNSHYQTTVRQQQQQQQQQQQRPQYMRLPSGFIVRVDSEGSSPPIIPKDQVQYQPLPGQQMTFLQGVVKKEPPDTSSPMAVDPSPGRLQSAPSLGAQPPVERPPVILARESVIQKGPQCTSLPNPPPTDPSRVHNVTIKQEVEADSRLSSWPEYPLKKPKAIESHRSTWPMPLSEFKRWKAEHPDTSFDEALKQLSISVDRNYKQSPHHGRKTIKVFMTYAREESRSHKKELSVLYNCLKKNGFDPSLDFMDPHEFNRDYMNWIDTKMKEADFVLVCISPQYKRDVEQRSEPSMLQNIHSVYCKYIHKMMQTEFANNNSQNRRFMPILFPGASTCHIPMWLQSTVAFRWRENWRDIMYMMLEPNKIMDRIKRNQEKFTPVIKMTQMCR